MKKSPLAFLLLMALSFSTAQAQLVNNGGTITTSATVEADAELTNDAVRANAQLRMQQERPPNPEIEAKRADLEAARDNVGDLRAEQAAELEARRAETQAMNAEVRANVESGEMDREEAKVQMTTQREEAREEAVENREERTEARSAVVSSRQALIDTRVAQIRAKDAGLADIVEDYYGQIMIKVEAVQTKQTALIEAVKAETMTAAEAKVEFKAYIEVEKAAINTLMAEMKAEIKAYREMKISSIDGE